MDGAVTLLPLYASMVWTVTSLLILYSFNIDCYSNKDCRVLHSLFVMVYVTTLEYFRLTEWYCNC
jgi:hypothetical protein